MIDEIINIFGSQLSEYPFLACVIATVTFIFCINSLFAIFNSIFTHLGKF